MLQKRLGKDTYMIKQIAWNTFKNTGNIKTMLELLEVEKTMENADINERKMNDINVNQIKNNINKT